MARAKIGTSSWSCCVVRLGLCTHVCMYICMYVCMYVCIVICILSYKVNAQASFRVILAFHLQHVDAHHRPCPRRVGSV
jgi:hypothetical protein